MNGKVPEITQSFPTVMPPSESRREDNLRETMADMRTVFHPQVNLVFVMAQQSIRY